MKIASHNGFDFVVSDVFKGEYLNALIDNLKVKYQNNFDDYNEVYHCNELIHKLQKDPDIKVEYHLMYKDKQCLGIAVISSGKIDSIKFFDQEFFKTNDNDIVLNYFHISPLGRGNGTYWLKEIILPYYQNKEYMYLKSSHPQAFSLYQRLGQEIGSYTTVSDNGDFKRNGKIFRIRV